METVDEMALASACVSIAATNLGLNGKRQEEWTDAEKAQVRAYAEQVMEIYRKPAREWFALHPPSGRQNL